MSIPKESLNKILAAFLRLLHNKDVLTNEDYEVIEIINQLMESDKE